MPLLNLEKMSPAECLICRPRSVGCGREVGFETNGIASEDGRDWRKPPACRSTQCRARAARARETWPKPGEYLDSSRSHATLEVAPRSDALLLPQQTALAVTRGWQAALYVPPTLAPRGCPDWTKAAIKGCPASESAAGVDRQGHVRRVL